MLFRMFSLVAPRPIGGTIEQFGFAVGQEGIIAVQIHANPRPSLTWTVDQEIILEGHKDFTQRFEANPVQSMVCIHQFS
jgi:hypothetical protein